MPHLYMIRKQDGCVFFVLSNQPVPHLGQYDPLAINGTSQPGLLAHFQQHIIHGSPNWDGMLALTTGTIVYLGVADGVEGL